MAWQENPLTKEQYTALLQLHDADVWDNYEAGLSVALKNSEDFRKLADQNCPSVVFLQEGYHKLQARALTRQLPPNLWPVEPDKLKPLPPPAELRWQPAVNLLHPLQLLSRELTGRKGAHGGNSLPCPVTHTEEVPFACVERCKLLEVQYVLKELQLQPTEQQQQQQQQQHQAVFMGADVHQQQHQDIGALQLRQQQQQLAVGQQQQQQQTHPSDSPFREYPLGRAQPEPRVCRRVSLRVVLQRLPAAPLPDECEQQAVGCDMGGTDSSSWQQRGLQGHGQVWQQVYMCTLEYPAFTLESSDYIVPADVFDRGITSWQGLQRGDPFLMPWDGTLCRGLALGYRQRRHGEGFVGSPWWSIAVEWEGHSTDPRKDPEDWCYGNPWEMVREANAGPPMLPDARTALAAVNKAGRPVLAAPWTRVWRDAVAAASTQAVPRRKRQGHHHHDEDFVYEDQNELAAHDAAEDLWEPTDFYYDDDPEDFVLHTNQRRQRSRYQQQQQQQAHSASRRSQRQVRQPRQRSVSPQDGDWGPAVAAGSLSKAQRAAAPAPDELTHTYGRQLLAPTDVCLVCGSSDGSLVSGHAGRSGGNCTRQYHRGCLLMLNAVGIRSVMLAKAGAQQRKLAQAASSAGVPLAAALEAEAAALCDGLLGQLMQQAQLGVDQHSAAVLAAVSSAQEAAIKVAAGELVLCCPSHGCHGCQLNGKHEFMVWCCCCWIRVYHHRQCVPYGAEHVHVGGKDFIRCPHCRAAGVPVPGSAQAAAAACLGGAASTGLQSPDPADAPVSAAAALQPQLQPDLHAGVPIGKATSGCDAPRAAVPSAAVSQSAAAAAMAAPTAVGSSQPAFDTAYAAGELASELQQQQQEQACSAGLPGASTGCSAGGQQVQPPHAAAAGAPTATSESEVVELLVSSDTDEHEHEVIVIDTTDDAEDRQQSLPPQLLQQQYDCQPVQQVVQQQQQERQPEQLQAFLPEQDLELCPPSSSSGRQTPAAAVVPAASTADAADLDDGDPMDVVAEVAQLEAQLLALLEGQPRDQHPVRNHQAVASQQKAQQQGHGPGHKDDQRVVELPVAADADAVTGRGGQPAVPQVLQAAVVDNGPVPETAGLDAACCRMPAWLRLALEDTDRTRPSYTLVPCAADGSSLRDRNSSSIGQDGAAHAAAVLAATTAAAATLPPASVAADDEQEGLQLASPHSHWLIGCLPKAEAQYKPANMWGCAIIGIPSCPDDSVYGLAVVMDFLPSLRQRQQELSSLSQAPVAAQQLAVTDPGPNATRARVPPSVYLRSSRAVAQRQQPTMQLGDDGGRRQGCAWQVLVNGRVYPERQGRGGVPLRAGDVVTVQGLSFKLQLAP